MAAADTEAVLCSFSQQALLIFRSLLQCVRQWAHARHLDCSNLGYLKGFALAVMCAVTCQRFPESLDGRHAEEGVEKSLLLPFFRLFSELWNWNDAIHFKPSQKLVCSNILTLASACKQQSYAAVPLKVLTPHTPSSCLTKCSTKSSLRRIQMGLRPARRK